MHFDALVGVGGGDGDGVVVGEGLAYLGRNMDSGSATTSNADSWLGSLSFAYSPYHSFVGS